MGIFNKDDKRPESKTSATIISEGTFIRGGIDTTGAVFCDGKVEGVIVSDTLTVGKSGEVIGNIKVAKLTVNGLVDGIINADDVHILEEGKVIGQMQYQDLSIDKSGVFEGEGKKKNSNLVSQYKHAQHEEITELIEEV